MFQTYRRPTVIVVGAGAAGCVAAAECAFAGFDTTLIDRASHPGGSVAKGGGGVAKKRTLTTPYLAQKKSDGTAAAFVAQLTDAVERSGAQFRGGVEATAAEFCEESGQWQVHLGADAGSWDVLVKATGESAEWIHVPGRGARTAAELEHVHRGVEPVGLPNALFVDGPEPPDERWLRRKPLEVLEARGDRCRRYVRQLEIRGPGAFTVRPDGWAASEATAKAEAAALREFDAGAHEFVPASGREDARNRNVKESA